MFHRYLRLTGVDGQGNRIAAIVNIAMIVMVCENASPGLDKRPVTTVCLHGCNPIFVYESVAEISRLMNLPESLSGPVLNPAEEI